MSVQTLFVCACCGEVGHVHTPDTTPGKNAPWMDRVRVCDFCGGEFETHEAVKKNGILKQGDPERVAEAKRRQAARPKQLELFNVVKPEYAM